MKIIPAILAHNKDELSNLVKALEEKAAFGDDWVQIDFMDNKFVQSKSIEPKDLENLLTEYKKEAHLMVEYPQSWIDDLKNLGFSRIIFPLEDQEGIPERINAIKNLGLQVGLSINPETPIEKITDFVATIDTVLIMSVHPGQGGQQFLETMFEKINKAKELGLRIGVDGGVTSEHARKLKEVGVDYAVVGVSRLLEGNFEKNVEEFKEAIS